MWCRPNERLIGDGGSQAEMMGCTVLNGQVSSPRVTRGQGKGNRRVVGAGILMVGMFKSNLTLLLEESYKYTCVYILFRKSQSSTICHF